jgi:hypothetical protein
VILLSLVLVVATATTLAWGVFASSDPLVWVSLATGIGAVALVAGSVVRHRRHPVPEAGPDAGRSTTGSAAVEAASAGTDPAPSPAPTRSVPAPPFAGPVSPPGAWPGTPTHPTIPPASGPPPAGGTPPDSPPAGSAPAGSAPAGSAPAGNAPAGNGPQGYAPVDTPAGSEAAGSAPAGAETQGHGTSGSSEAGAGGGWTGAVPVTAPTTGPPANAAEGARVEAEGEPGVEQVAVRDALRVAQLADEVLVVDGHPRYHVAGCPALRDAGTVALAVSAARRGGFTPCAICRPDATLLARSRARTQQQAHDRTTERPSGEGQQL